MKSKRIALTALGLVVIGGVVAGTVFLHRYRQRQARDEVSRVAKEVFVLTLRYGEEHDKIMDAKFQQQEIDQAAHFGIATQDPEMRFDELDWMEAMASLARQYMQDLGQIDASSCPRDFREAFEEYVQTLRAQRREMDSPTTNEALERASKNLKEAGTRLAELAHAYEATVILPLGHRD